MYSQSTKILVDLVDGLATLTVTPPLFKETFGTEDLGISLMVPTDPLRLVSVRVEG